MFKGIGKKAVKGAIEQLGNSGESLAKALAKVGKGAFKATVIPPLLINILGDVPELWDSIPQEKKQELFNALIAAATKAATSYAKGGGKVRF